MSMMSVYDNWERLVGAVLQREKDYLLAHCDSISTYSSNVHSPRLSFDISGMRPPIEYVEIKKATRNFERDELSDQLGFSGWLDEVNLTAANPGTGMKVAVKVLRPHGRLEHTDWLGELSYLSQIYHPNVVMIVGYCSGEDNLVLVSESVKRGSLNMHLFTRRDYEFSWATRVKVVVGAARALSFLHNRDLPVRHRDFKTSDILLDEEFNAKLFLFVGARDRNGTPGYVAPEYLMTGRSTTKCNVYSFGVVLLELLVGYRVNNASEFFTETVEMWAKRNFGDKKSCLEAMDDRLKGGQSNCPLKEAYKVGKLAIKCLNRKPRLRPNMIDVLFALEHL